MNDTNVYPCRILMRGGKPCDEIAGAPIQPPKPEARKVGRPKLRVAKRVTELLAKGLTHEQIATELGCAIVTVRRALAEHRKADPDVGAAHKAAQVCPGCGLRKMAQVKQCFWCRTKRTRPEARRG